MSIAGFSESSNRLHWPPSPFITLHSPCLVWCHFWVTRPVSHAQKGRPSWEQNQTEFSKTMSETLNWKRISLCIVLVKQKWKKKMLLLILWVQLPSCKFYTEEKPSKKELSHSLGNLRAKEVWRLWCPKLGRPNDLSVTGLDPLLAESVIPKTCWGSDGRVASLRLPPSHRASVWFAQSIRVAIKEMNTEKLLPGAGGSFVRQVTTQQGSMSIRKAAEAPMKPRYKAKGRELIHGVRTLCQALFLSSSSDVYWELICQALCWKQRLSQHPPWVWIAVYQLYNFGNVT